MATKQPSEKSWPPPTPEAFGLREFFAGCALIGLAGSCHEDDLGPKMMRLADLAMEAVRHHGKKDEQAEAAGDAGS